MLTLALVLLATLGPAVVAATAAVWVPTWRQVTLLLLLPVTAGLGLSGLLGMSGWLVALLLIYLSLLLAPLVPFRKRWHASRCPERSWSRCSGGWSLRGSPSRQ